MTDLFDYAARARQSDPATSKLAALRAKHLAAGDAADILRVLDCGRAMAAEQIADEIGHGDAVRICRRMKELERLDLIEATAELHRNRSGRHARKFRSKK